MKKIIFLALVFSAHYAVAIDGNKWMDDAQSTDDTRPFAAFIYLAGIVDTLKYSGLGNLCPDVPAGVDTRQVQAILIKWFEDNPQNRHFDVSHATFEALGDAYGFVPANAGGMCVSER